MVDYVKASKNAKAMGLDISPSVLKNILTTPKSNSYKLAEAIQQFRTHKNQKTKSKPCQEIE